MGGTELLIAGVIAAGLLVFSGLLLKPKKGPKLQRDDEPTTISTRGAYLPIVLGTRRIGYVFGHAWGRYTIEETVAEGGGKGGDAPDQKQTVYYEYGWHQLCVGPIGGILEIWEGSEQILPAPVYAHEAPSGTLIDCGVHGAFRVYWGEFDQVADAALSTDIGYEASWAPVAYVVWQPKRLGTGPTWQPIEYVVRSCDPEESAPAPSSSDAGWNPAACLHRLLTAEYPHGAGLGGSLVNGSALSEAAAVFAGEGVAANLLVEGEYSEVIEGLLADCGLAMPERAGRLHFVPVRHEATVPVIGEGVIVGSIPRASTPLLHRANRRVTFTFKDAEHAYRDTDIQIDDESNDSDRFDAEEVAITTATDLASARSIANRRSQEYFGDAASFRFRVARDAASRLVPGHAAEIEGLGPVRIASTRYLLEDHTAEVEAVVDSYGVAAVEDADDAPLVGSEPRDAEHDLRVRVYELPREIAGENVRIAVLRVAAHDQIVGANVHLSIDGGGYAIAGRQTYASVGGEILTSMSAGVAGDVLPEGPVVLPDTQGYLGLLDLSSRTAAWQDGLQAALIDDEVIFVQAVTVLAETEWSASEAISEGDARSPSAPTGLRYVCTTAGTTGATEPAWPEEAGETVTDGTVVWEAQHFRIRLDNVIRGRFGTEAAGHAENAEIFVFDSSRISPIAAAGLLPGAEACVRTQPYTLRGTVEVNSAVSACAQLTGRALRDTFVIDADGTFLVSPAGDRLVE